MLITYISTYHLTLLMLSRMRVLCGSCVFSGMAMRERRRIVGPGILCPERRVVQAWWASFEVDLSRGLKISSIQLASQVKPIEISTFENLQEKQFILVAIDNAEKYIPVQPQQYIALTHGFMPTLRLDRIMDPDDWLRTCKMPQRPEMARKRWTTQQRSWPMLRCMRRNCQI